MPDLSLRKRKPAGYHVDVFGCGNDDCFNSGKKPGRSTLLMGDHYVGEITAFRCAYCDYRLELLIKEVGWEDVSDEIAEYEDVFVRIICPNEWKKEWKENYEGIFKAKLYKKDQIVRIDDTVWIEFDVLSKKCLYTGLDCSGDLTFEFVKDEM